MIGIYGPVFFGVGGTPLIFDDLRKQVTARWGVHEVFRDKPLLEYAGPQLIEVSFKMQFLKPFTADPLASILLLEETMDFALPYPLVIGHKPMGRGLSLFVMEALEVNPKYFYRGGSFLGAEVDVKLKEYPNISISSLIGALRGLLGGGGGIPADAVSAATGSVSMGPLVQVEGAANSAITSVAQASRL